MYYNTYYSLPVFLLECKLHQGTVVGLFCTLVYNQHLQCAWYVVGAQ